MQFDDGVYRHQPVRLAQLTHVMEDADVKEPLLKITVAETMEARQQLIQSILWDTLGSQGLLLLAAALFLFFQSKQSTHCLWYTVFHAKNFRPLFLQRD